MMLQIVINVVLLQIMLWKRIFQTMSSTHHIYGQVLQIWIRSESTMDQRLLTPTLMEFYSTHPPIYVFLDVLLKQQTVTYIKIRGLDVVAANRREGREKQTFLSKFQKYENGEMTRQQFLKRMGYKYSARTDM